MNSNKIAIYYQHFIDAQKKLYTLKLDFTDIQKSEHLPLMKSFVTSLYLFLDSVTKLTVVKKESKKYVRIFNSFHLSFLVALRDVHESLIGLNEAQKMKYQYFMNNRHDCEHSYNNSYETLINNIINCACVNRYYYPTIVGIDSLILREEANCYECN